MLGRFLQEQFGQEPQVVITTPLLEGLDGVQKMSKSLGNAIGLAEAADQAFGKLMSISDKLMWRYLELLLHVTSEEISELQEKVAYGSMHPMALKKDMAHKIIARFWSAKEADKARDTFEALFQKKDYSKAKEVALPKDLDKKLWIVDLLRALDAIKSSSEAKRLIESGAVSLNDKPVKDFKDKVTWKSGMIVKVGKHKFYKIK